MREHSSRARTVALCFTAVHLLGSIWLLMLMLAGWGFSGMGVDLPELFGNDWFKIALWDGIKRAALLSSLATACAFLLISGLLFEGRVRALRWLIILAAVCPLLFNFPLRAVIWKILLMGRPFGDIALPWTLPASPVVHIALFSQCVSLALLFIYGRIEAASPSRIQSLRSWGCGFWLALRVEFWPLMSARFFATLAFIFVVSATDLVAVPIVGDGRASNIAVFILERFRLNDYGAASSASLVCAVFMSLVIIVSVVVFSRRNP